MTRSKLIFLAEFQKSLPYFLSYQAGEHFFIDVNYQCEHGNPSINTISY